MKQIVLDIPDNKYPFFKELIKSLGFVMVKNEPKLTKKQQKYVNGLKSSIDQVEQHMHGKIKLKTADQLLDEL